MSEDSHVQLYVGVRFFGGAPADPVSIVVMVDGKEVIAGNFPTPQAIKAPDSAMINLAKGKHALIARGARAKGDFRTEFKVTKDEHWAQLCYDLYPGDHPHAKEEGFNFEIQDTPYGWR